jgi:hypothetical protein
MFLFSYTCIWNILDYTALSFPTGMEADKKIDTIPKDEKTFGELDTKVQSLCKSTHNPSQDFDRRRTKFSQMTRLLFTECPSLYS